MAQANQITPRRRPGASARAGTDLSGFLDRLRATVVSAPPCALGPTPTRPGDALVMRINREATRLCAQETQLRELVRERTSLESRLAEDKRVIYDLTAQAAAASMRSHETAEQLTQHAARIQQLRLTTAEEQKTMRSAARSLQIWIEQKLADITDPTVLEGVETTLAQVNSEARAYDEFARDLSAKHHAVLYAARSRIFAEHDPERGGFAAQGQLSDESTGDPIAHFVDTERQTLGCRINKAKADIAILETALTEAKRMAQETETINWTAVEK